MAKRRKLARGGSTKQTAGSSKKKAPPQQQQQQQQQHKGKFNSGEHSTPKKKAQQNKQQNDEPTIPFSQEDRILLVGEGDLSFAASLVTSHYCTSVTATVLEKSRDELVEKYPHAAENIDAIESEDGCGVRYNVDATSMKPFTSGSDRVGVMDRIFFNFPHVGGKSTDVNRQVRYNQELLVSFFGRALSSLAPRGSIIVTLFEGEPYTLWNVRDLGRHSGLRVERSFRFNATAYPGYHHARTLGVVRSRHNAEEAASSAWKGEDRLARSYVFVRRDEDEQKHQNANGKKSGASANNNNKKRSRGDDSDGDSE